MKISIDGDDSICQCEPNDSVKVIIEELQSFVTSAGKTIEKVTLDGNVIGADIDEKTLVQSYEILEVTTAITDNMPVMMLAQVKEGVGNLKEKMMETANKVQEGDIPASLEIFALVCEGWDTLHQAIISLSRFKNFNLDEVKVGDVAVSKVIAEPTQFIAELEEAMKSKDYITVADILEFEVLPLMDKFDDALEAIRPLVEAP